MTNNELLFCTGWHTLSGYYLRDGFFGCDCEPLDAPDLISAGSTRNGGREPIPACCYPLYLDRSGNEW